MAYVKRRKNETVDEMLKRFQKKVVKEGIMKEVERHKDVSKHRRKKQRN